MLENLRGYALPEITLVVVQYRGGCRGNFLRSKTDRVMCAEYRKLNRCTNIPGQTVSCGETHLEEAHPLGVPCVYGPFVTVCLTLLP